MCMIGREDTRPRLYKYQKDYRKGEQYLDFTTLGHRRRWRGPEFRTKKKLYTGAEVPAIGLGTFGSDRFPARRWPRR